MLPVATGMPLCGATATRGASWFFIPGVAILVWGMAAMAPLSARLSLRLPAGPSRPALGLRLLVARSLQQLLQTP